VGIAFALASMVCFAVNIFIVRNALMRVPVGLGFLVMLAVNVLFAALLFGIELAVRDEPFAVHWKAAGLFALAGLIGIYLGRRTMLDAVQLMGPARASVLHSASPLFTLVGAWILVGERLGAYEIGVMALVMLGLWFAQPTAGGGGMHGPELDAKSLKRAAVLTILTVGSFGFGNALRGTAIRDWNEPVFGALLGVATALTFELLSSRKWRTKWHGLRVADRRGLLLYSLSGVVTVLGTMFSSVSMHYIEIAIATLIGYTTPLVVFPISVLVLRNRESLTLRTACGALMVLAGITLLAIR
jgi:drug/metabolite transporter (DMT)-like permease